jgi:hypothetical protein
LEPLTGARYGTKVHGQMMSGPRNFDVLEYVVVMRIFHFFDLFFLTRKKFQLFILNSYGVSFFLALLYLEGDLKSPESNF